MSTDLKHFRKFDLQPTKLFGRSDQFEQSVLHFAFSVVRKELDERRMALHQSEECEAVDECCVGGPLQFRDNVHEFFRMIYDLGYWGIFDGLHIVFAHSRTSSSDESLNMSKNENLLSNWTKQNAKMYVYLKSDRSDSFLIRSIFSSR